MYDCGDIPKWNFEVEPFITLKVVQMEENTHKLRAIEDHMPP
jgi:hypothetical protein